MRTWKAILLNSKGTKVKSITVEALNPPFAYQKAKDMLKDGMKDNYIIKLETT